MNNDKGKFNSIQLVFLFAGFVQGSVLLISFTAGITEHQTWIVVLLGFLLTLPFLLSYILLAKRFPGMSIIEINDIVFGKILGKVLSVYYLFFIFMTLSFNIRDIGTFYKTFLMPDTPFMFFIVIFTAACAYAAAKGIEVLARVSHLFVFISLSVIIGTFLLQIDNMNFSNFLPIFDLPLIEFIQGIHIMAVIPFGEAIVFLVIMKSLNNTTNIVKRSFTGLTIGGIALLTVAIRNTAVLGVTESIWTNSAFQSVRLIDLGNIFTRMDLLIGFNQTIIMYFKCCLFLYALLIAFADIFHLKSYRTLIIPICGIQAVLAATVFQSPAEQSIITINSGIFYSTPLLFMVPPITLLTAKIRKLPKEENK